MAERRYVNVTPAVLQRNSPGFAASPPAWADRIAMHPDIFQIASVSRSIRADHRSRYLPSLPKDVNCCNARHGWREYCQSQHGIRVTGKDHLRSNCATLNHSATVYRFTNGDVDRKGSFLVCKVCMDYQTSP